MVAVRCISRALSPASLASQLPQVPHPPGTPQPCGSQLAGDSRGALYQASPVAGIAGKPAPTIVYGPCGSQLAGDSRGALYQTSPVTGIAGKPAPTMVYGPCGSQLAGDGSGALYQASPVAGIAGKPAPTSASPSWNTPTLWEPAPTKPTISLIPACEIHFAAQCLTRLERPQVVDKQLHHQRRRCRRRAMTGQQQTPGRPEWMLGR